MEEKIKIDIDKVGEAEFIDLNHRIVERLRVLSQMRAHLQMLDFKIGEHVTFYPDGHPLIPTAIRLCAGSSLAIIEKPSPS